MPRSDVDIKFGSAISDLPDTAAAMDAVLAELSAAGTSGPDLAIVFTTFHHRDQMAVIQRKLEESLAPALLIACTAQGVIGIGREIEEAPGISVLAARMPGVRIEPVVLHAGAWATILSSAESLRSQIATPAADLAALILLADPFSSPMVNLLARMAQAFPGVPVVGGMASGAAGAGGNRLMVNGQVFRDGAVGVALAGPIDVSSVVSQGCRPIGRPLVITKSQRHLVMELSGRQALKALQEMAQELNDEDRHLIEAGGLTVGRVIDEYKGRFGRGDFLIRGLMGVDQDHGYIAIGDPLVRVGQTIQFHVRDKKTAIEDFQLLLDAQQLHATPEGALLFSCNGRGARLFDQPNQDALLIQQALGDVPIAGFFAAGEIGPIGGQSFVHGHTASLVVFRAKGDA